MKLIKEIIIELLIDIGLLWMLKVIRDIIWRFLDYKIPVNIYTTIAAIALVTFISFKIDKWK